MPDIFVRHEIRIFQSFLWQEMFRDAKHLKGHLEAQYGILVHERTINKILSELLKAGLIIRQPLGVDWPAYGYYLRPALAKHLSIQ